MKARSMQSKRYFPQCVQITMAFCNLCVTVFREELFAKSGSLIVIGSDGIGFKGRFAQVGLDWSVSISW